MKLDALLIGPAGHGGEEVYVRTLRENPPEGVNYRVAGPFHAGAPGVDCAAGTEILLNRIVHPVAVPDMGFRALRISRPVDLVHVHAHPVRLSGLGGAPVVMSEGSSLAVYLGEYCGWSRERLGRAFRRGHRIYRSLGIYDRLLAQDRAKRVYVFSEWARRVNLDWGADPGKTVVLAPGFATPPETQRPEHEQFRFLFVGTYFERKGGFELVEAFDALAADRPGAQLTIVSPDPAASPQDPLQRSWVSPARRQRVLERLAALERAGRLVRIDLMDRSRLMTEHFGQADAFVMPAHAEGFGFTNVEAMSFGLPVISSRVGPIPEVIADGDTGLLVEPGDVASLTEAMVTLLDDRDRTRRMGAAARESFLSRFTLRHLCEGLGEIYRQALEG